MAPDIPLPPGSDLAAVAGWALGIMQSFGLQGWSFRYNKRVRALGLCRHFRRRIELSIHLVQRNSGEEVRDTLLHEIAHALVGRGHGHDAIWRAKCTQVGCKPERCGEADMPGARYHKYRRPKR